MPRLNIRASLAFATLGLLFVIIILGLYHELSFEDSYLVPSFRTSPSISCQDCEERDLVC